MSDVDAFTVSFVEMPDTRLRVIVEIDGRAYHFTPRQAEELSARLHCETQSAVDQIAGELDEL